MKKYKASEELAEILIKNGFVENTKTKYPDHYNRLLNNGYSPNSVKRSFLYKPNHNLIFDYINIVPYYRKSCNGTEIKIELTENEIKSIITFYKLSSQHKSYFKKTGDDIPNLYTEYESYKSYISSQNKLSKYQTDIIKIFDEIKI